MTFTVGQRVQLHPATDRWMRGDKYGEVVSVGRKLILVKLDRSGRTMAFLPKEPAGGAMTKHEEQRKAGGI